MKALASSSRSNIFKTNSNGNIMRLGSWRELACNRHEVCFFPSNKFGFLVCVKHKNPLSPLSASSLSADSQVELVAADIEDKDTSQTRTVRVKFLLQKECSFGEQFMVVGDDPILGFWDPECAVPMDWSDGHVWSVELDIPVEKSIQFKFILKAIAGKILWQPGVDRILKTWETSKMIVVCEDWEDEALQKIMEEEVQIDNENSESFIKSETLVVEKSTAENEEQPLDTNEEMIFSFSNPCEQENPVPVVDESPIVANNIEPVREKPMPMVAENIKEEHAVTASSKVFVEERIDHEVGRLVANSNNSSIAGARNSTIAPVEEEPVLVPGLPPVLAVGNNESAGTTAALDGSIKANEVVNHNMPELDGTASDRWLERTDPLNNTTTESQQETIRASNNEQQQFEQEAEKDLCESKPMYSNIMHEDVQWGRRTIQKLLNDLGLL